MPCGAPFDFINKPLQRLKERVAGASNSSPNHDRLGIEDINKGNDGARQIAHGLQPDRSGQRVTGAIRSNQLMSTMESPMGAGLNGAIADRILQTAGSASDIQAAPRLQADVAQVPGPSEMPSEQPAVHHHRAAHAGAQGEHDYIFKASSGPNPAFSNQRRMGIIEHRDRTPKPEELRPIEAFQALQPGWHMKNGAAVGGCKTRGRDTDGWVVL